ncbi:protein ELYS [Aplysia californica]|uniref:Protein ELYS n=1 Tax=Aplysia californica TaxID=6500 RepID=A0ABM0ZVP6_APLCA|nr:protein ELYS [Aplysia californica]
MKLELKPDFAEEVKSHHFEASHAGVSKDGQVSWVYNSSLLQVKLAQTGEILSTWRCGKTVRDPHSSIVCVTDLCHKDGHLLLVATTSLSDQGLLCFFSVKQKKVIKAIEIPQKITAVEVVFSNGDEDPQRWVLSQHLLFFSGLVAIGTEGGYIYLVDLGLDELLMSQCNEISPKKLSVITPRIVDPRAKRDQARMYDKHLALLLDEQCHREGLFYYRRQDDTVQKVLDEDTVCVTSLKYLSQAGELAVGFNFGSFQLWRLYNPVLDYSSNYNPGLAVTNFIAQEPENDPRNFVYLWVGHDDYDRESTDTVAFVSLYQLSFLKKDVYAGFGVFYDELESVCARMDHHLTVDPYMNDFTTTRNSRILSCFTISHPFYKPVESLSDSYDEGLHSNDLSLSVFVWRSESKQQKRISHWMCVFDLNRWYHAQMPHSIRCHGGSLQVCSYWAVYRLDDVADLMAPHPLLNVEVRGDKVLRFVNSSPLPPEEHSFPSSLRLTGVRFVSAVGSVDGTCDGWQGHLLQQMGSSGAELLVVPTDFYHQCLRARLLPQMFEETKSSSPEYQRKVLLDMALERGLIAAVVHQCIQLWADGDYTQQGCTLTLLLDWAWERTISIKNSLNSTCEVLYDWSAHHVDPRTNRQLQSYTGALAHLKLVFSVLMSQAAPTTERGIIELELRLDVINLLLQHYDLVRWSLSVNLLPEVDEVSDPAPGLFAYPITDLGEKYKMKRAHLQGCQRVVEDLSLLLIDNLVECEGDQIKKLWGDQGGNGLYPPPSMQALLHMYLLHDVSLSVKHAITLYLLRDLAALGDTDMEDTVIPSFIQRFFLNPSLVHQVQGLWSIDDGDFEEGLRRLVNPCVRADICGNWNRDASVVNTLLGQGQNKVAIRYLHALGAGGGSLQEQHLYISTLVRNRQEFQALEFVRRSNMEDTAAQLFDHLLSECQKERLLGQLLRWNLREVEEKQLERHLRGRGEVRALEPLLLYHLNHSQFVKAFQLHDDMKHMDKLETSVVAQEQAASRNRLMQAYLYALPDITRKLLMEKHISSAAKAPRRLEVSKPKPLSTVVRNADRNAMARSNFVLAVMERVREVEQSFAAELDGEEGEITRKDLRGELSMSPEVPFLKTPKTLRPGGEEQFAEKVVYPELKNSLMANDPLSAARRKILSKSFTADFTEHTETKSLHQLTMECVKVLQTPKREQKKKRERSPGVSAVTSTKTPQSILKIRRLSKVLLPGSNEMSGGRRTSTGSSSRKRQASKSDSSLNSPTQLSTPKPQPGATPMHTFGSSAKPKHLRFVGLSPTLTPSPSREELLTPPSDKVVMAEESSSKRQEPEVPAEAESPPNLHSVTQKDEPDVQTAPETVSSTTTTATSVTTVTEEKKEKVLGDPPAALQETVEQMDVSTGNTSQELPSPIDDSPRYGDSFEKLERPDLQSIWKDSENTTEMVVDDEITFNLHHTEELGPPAVSMTSSPMDSSVPKTSQEAALNGANLVSVTVQKTTSAMSLSTAEILATSESTFLEQTLVTSHKSFSSPSMEKSGSGPALSSGLVVDTQLEDKIVSSMSRSALPLRSLISSTSLSPTARRAHVNFESSPESRKSVRADSPPPATPPLSRKAKLLSSKVEDMFNYQDYPKRRTRSTTPSPARSETEEKLHRKRSRKTSELEKPDRNVEDLDIKDAEMSIELVLPKKKVTPDRSPAKNRTFIGEESVKVTMMVSESFSTLEERTDVSERRQTPDRSARKSAKLALGSESEQKEKREKRTTDTSTSQLAKSVLETDESESVLDDAADRQAEGKRTLGREVSVSRESRAFSVASRTKTPERDSAHETSISVGTRRSTRHRTPDRTGHKVSEIVMTQQSEGIRRKKEGPIVSSFEGQEEEEKTQTKTVHNALTKEIHQIGVKARSSDAPVTRQTLQKSRSPSKPESLLEVHSEDNTFDQSLSSSMQKEMLKTSETFSRRQTRRKSKSPSKPGISKEVSSEDMSARGSVRRQTRGKSKSPSKPEATLEVQSEDILDRSLRRSRRQSKTPERFLAPALSEPLTPTRRSKRLPKSPEKLNTSEIESVRPIATSTSPKQPSPQRDLKENSRTVKNPEAPLTPTRRSKRKPKSPQRLNTDDIEPVHSSSSPVRLLSPKEMSRESSPGSPDRAGLRRSKRGSSTESRTPSRDSSSVVEVFQTRRRTPDRHTAGTKGTTPSKTGKRTRVSSASAMKKITEEEKDGVQTGEEKESMPEWSEDMPPLRFDAGEEGNTVTESSDESKQHRLKRRTTKEDVAQTAQPNYVFSPPVKQLVQTEEVGDGEGSVSPVYVFSAPTVASEALPQQASKKSRNRQKKKALYDETVMLLPSPSTSPRERSRSQSSNQQARVAILKRYKPTGPRTRRLRPSVKS